MPLVPDLSDGDSSGGPLVLLTAEQHEKLAQAFYRASHDKKVPAEKRLEYRTKGAKRHRLLAKLARKRESHRDHNGQTQA